MGGMVLAGCGTSPTVAQWEASTQFGQHLGALEADDARIAADLRTVPPAATTKADCSLLVADLSGTAGDLPTPDVKLTSLLSAAYHDEQAAAADCVAGFDGAPGDLARAQADRRRAQRLLIAALARILTVTGKVPSTSTTTTIPGGIFG